MVTGIFGRYAKRDDRDLSSIEHRMPIGITPEVIQSYREIYAPAGTSIGLRGFSFKQYGLKYEVFYKDEQGNDLPHFIVTRHTAQPFLHREQTMCIAEKAHAFLVVKELMGEALRESLKNYLFQVEKACFKPDSGRVALGVTGIRRMAGSMDIVEHLGLGFPDDSEYEQEPCLKIMMLEWIHGTHHMAIDNSGDSPVFTKGSERNPDGKRYYMAQGEALKALEYALKYASNHNTDLHHLGYFTGFWTDAEEATTYLSSHPKPVGP